MHTLQLCITIVHIFSHIRSLSHAAMHILASASPQRILHRGRGKLLIMATQTPLEKIECHIYRISNLVP